MVRKKKATARRRKRVIKPSNEDMVNFNIPGPLGPITIITGEEAMDVPQSIHEQTLSRLSSVGAQAHEHFQQFNKILDLNYEADRKMVSLVQSLGVREVTSQSGQLGVPMAGGQAGRP